MANVKYSGVRESIPDRINERLVLNRTYTGYRGSLTFTEDLYDNL